MAKKSERLLSQLFLAVITAVILVLPAPAHTPRANAADFELAQDGSINFPETNKTLKGWFLRYWREHGGLAQHGYPISDEIEETSALDGKTYTVQYFERSVFELHPENQPP